MLFISGSPKLHPDCDDYRIKEMRAWQPQDSIWINPAHHGTILFACLPFIWSPHSVCGERGACSGWQGDYAPTDVIGGVRSRSNVEWLYILTQLLLKSRVIRYVQDVWLVLVTWYLTLNSCCFLNLGLSYLPMSPIELKPLGTKIRRLLP